LLVVIPGHPQRRVGRQFPMMPQKVGQVVERVNIAKLAGVNQAHEQIAHLGSVQSSIK
jgi:hypothetical protein